MQRLTGLDASFLYLETPSSHMHVASLRSSIRRTVEGGVVARVGQRGLRAGACTWPRRSGAAWPRCPSGSTTRSGSRTPTSTSTTTSATRPSRRPAAPRELSNLVGRLVGHAARPQPPALGDLADRGPGGRQRRPALQGPPRRHRRRVGQRAARRPARPHARGRRARARDRSGCPTACRPTSSCSATRPSSLARQPVRVAKALGPHGQRGARRPPARPGVAADPRCRRRRSPRRARRSTPRSRRAAATRSPRVACRTVKAVKAAAGCTVNDVVLAPVRRRAAHLPRRPRRGARRAARGDGAGVGPHRGREGRDGQQGQLDALHPGHRRRRPRRAPPGHPRVHGARRRSSRRPSAPTRSRTGPSSPRPPWPAGPPASTPA